MKDFLVKNLKWVVISIVVLLAINTIRSCVKDKLYDENSILKGKIEAQESALLQKDRDIETMTRAHDARVAELNAKVDEANGKIAEYAEGDKKQAETLTELQRAEATITDKDELIANLRAQIDIWKSRFDLAQKTIAEKDNIIFSLTEKYESEHKLRLEITFDRDTWKAQYFQMKALNDLNEKRYVAEKRKGKWGKAENWAWRIWWAYNTAKGALKKNG